MLGGGLGVRLLVLAAAAPAPPVPAPPGKSRFPLSSSLRRRSGSSSWWLSCGNAPRERYGRTATTSSRAARRRWWSDPEGSQQDYGYHDSSSLEEEDEDGDDYGDEDEAAFPGLGGAGELFDEPWFSKVFKTYGFLLPVMLVSMLAATGPKAFLMAMAIPLGQSAISFLLDAVWGRRRSNRDDRWRQSQEEEDDYPEDTMEFGAGGRGKGYSGGSSYYEGRRRRHSYQSWVSNDVVDSASSGGGTDDNKTNSSSNGDGGGNKSSGRFGGWDDLLDNNIAAAQDEKRSSNSSSAGNTDYSKRPQPSATWQEDADDTAGNARRMGQGVRVPPTRMRMRRQRTPRMTGLGPTRYKQAPLLMRLLVAVFPFLGSWFRLL